jgi:hypothetical protein
MRLIAAIELPEVVCAILGSLGLASPAPPIAVVRLAEFFCDPDFEIAGAADDLSEPPSD